MVDRVSASCYASFNHDLAHIGVKPIQWFPQIMKWIIGTEDGSSTYMNIIKMFGKMGLPYGQLLQK